MEAAWLATYTMFNDFMFCILSSVFCHATGRLPCDCDHSKNVAFLIITALLSLSTRHWSLSVYPYRLGHQPSSSVSWAHYICGRGNSTNSNNGNQQQQRQVARSPAHMRSTIAWNFFWHVSQVESVCSFCENSLRMPSGMITTLVDRLKHHVTLHAEYIAAVKARNAN